MVSINLQKKATPIKCTARKNLTPVDANKSLEDVKTIKQKVRSTIYWFATLNENPFYSVKMRYEQLVVVLIT